MQKRMNPHAVTVLRALELEGLGIRHTLPQVIVATPFPTGALARLTHEEVAHSFCHHLHDTHGIVFRPNPPLSVEREVKRIVSRADCPFTATLESVCGEETAPDLSVVLCKPNQSDYNHLAVREGARLQHDYDELVERLGLRFWGPLGFLERTVVRHVCTAMGHARALQKLVSR